MARGGALVGVLAKVVLDEYLFPPPGAVAFEAAARRVAAHAASMPQQRLEVSAHARGKAAALRPSFRPAEQEGRDRLAVHGGRLGQARQPEEGGGEVDLRARRVEGRAGDDAGAAGEEVDPSVPRVDVPPASTGGFERGSLRRARALRARLGRVTGQGGRRGAQVGVPPRSLVHRDVELAELEAVVGRVEEVRAVPLPQLLHGRDHVGDQIVHRHQRAPAVLEDGRDHVGGGGRQHGLRRDVAVVLPPALRRAVPVGRARLVVGPRRVPRLEVPRGWDERLVRCLGSDVREKGPVAATHDGTDPLDGRVADHRRRVVVVRPFPVPVRLARDVLRHEGWGDVVAAAVGEPDVETGRDRVRHLVEVLAEHADRVPGLLGEDTRERRVVHLRVVLPGGTTRRVRAGRAGVPPPGRARTTCIPAQ